MTNQPPRIVINGQPLPPEAIEFELGRLVKFYCQHMPEEQVRAQLPALRAHAVEQAIGAKLLFDEAARLKPEVPDGEVDERLAEMKKQGGGAKKFEALLQQQGMSVETLREQIRAGRRVDKLVEQVVALVPEPTEDEMRAHFTGHQDEYVRPERAQTQHILVRPAGEDEVSRTAALEKIKAIRERVQTGGSFADEAAAHSECPSGRESGGSLGWFGRGMMVPAFDEAAFRMKVGELSEIVETQFGYHIIQKTGHEQETATTFEEVQESIRDFLRHAARGAALSAHVDGLKAKAKIDLK
ncbi:MAG: peptidylprolyl isomerase [Kiritimatiellia bacterium]